MANSLEGYSETRLEKQYREALDEAMNMIKELCSEIEELKIELRNTYKS